MSFLIFFSDGLAPFILLNLKRFLSAACGVFVFLVFAISLHASVLTVTTLDDTDDSVCDAQCSMREAISTASPGDTIIFSRELRGGTIQLFKTLLIDKWLTIDGPNKHRITIQGNNTFRIFHIDNSSSVRVVTLDGLIIQGGNQPDGDGGGIYMDHNHIGTLNITNCAIIGNSGQRGGGISTYYGRLFLIDSTVANNTATADYAGGGLDADHTIVQIMNSTISGNRTTSVIDGAGGIRLNRPKDWFIIGSTIAFNSSNGSSVSSVGGLAALAGSPGPVDNTILARNEGLNPDFYGVSSGARNSLIGITDYRSGFSTWGNNITGTIDAPVDPLLGSLADNGGGLPTNALLPGSPAVDSGNNDLSVDRHGDPLTVDQRGYIRPVNSIVDIGSYEFNSQPLATTSTITGQVTDANGRPVYKAHVSLKRSGIGVKHAITDQFGFYSFVSVPSDISYTLECKNKRTAFPMQNVLIEEKVETVNFVEIK